jgi:hypothetical protein
MPQGSVANGFMLILTYAEVFVAAGVTVTNVLGAELHGIPARVDISWRCP